jgi:hypothetical protein
MINNLLQAYKSTKYKLFKPNLIIQIGVLNNELNDLLGKNNATEWAYITAYNPFSRVLTDIENQSRHLELKELTRSYLTYEGHGVRTDPSWEPELSLLIIGISKEEAILIGKKFEQNAIVYGTINIVPELLILI